MASMDADTFFKYFCGVVFVTCGAIGLIGPLQALELRRKLERLKPLDGLYRSPLESTAAPLVTRVVSLLVLLAGLLFFA